MEHWNAEHRSDGDGEDNGAGNADMCSRHQIVDDDVLQIDDGRIPLLEAEDQTKIFRNAKETSVEVAFL
jgi:hypothetical protein